MDIFTTCHKINDLLLANNENEARNELIKLLDFHEREKLAYSELVNHLIRESGLYPYLELETASWQDKFVYEVFKVDVGEEAELTLHREQSALLKKLLDGKNLAVSAPTSFGKSFVIDAYISMTKPKNVVIIVPTIALTDETRRRVYKKFASEYKIITTTDVELAEKNIFIFPQERAISYVNKIEDLDILIIDEFYKASSNFDKERSPTLVKAILKLGKIAKQKYFLAPNISSLEDNPFTQDMEFYPLDFNTVYLEQQKLYEKIKGDEELKSTYLLDIISPQNKKTLIYAGTYVNIERLSNLLLANFPAKETKLLLDFSNWLSTNYDYNWNLTNLVKRGVGIHNGRLHRSLSQIQVKLFEESEGIDNLLSTSSIIEGVNTSAENVIIWSNKNGQVKINDFTYRNIMGRGGRMFRHFIGKIFILEQPPAQTQTQLGIPFPEEILGDLDEVKYEKELTKEQVARIILYKEEMSNLLGNETFQRLQSENIFQSSDSELIKKIAVDMIAHPDEWNGLSFLNSPYPGNWERFLYKIISIVPAGWDARHKTFVEFVKILRNNWFKNIPELLSELDKYEIGVDDFFKLERKVTFKLASLVGDINILQKEILKDKNYDISRFMSWCSHAFLPGTVYQLEEFGLPRMISKKIHQAGVYNFTIDGLTIHKVIDDLNSIGLEKISQIDTLMDFDKYILSYFFDGIKVNRTIK
ncbi:DEAD/DEAH box helicase [Chryseobacterium shandongense]|uniref:DEAD/DEAH box helicase n=1 Tax=Chryseobacterium shandongense TaxID=1493872 RepID=A0ABN5RY66_9FLAO|nr:DEAD/DEAH box helicase [Chryseobacterium shandongense]AZA95669.1 DEAD/DEAH box helicase [Chryseobacterium shandongense]